MLDVQGKGEGGVVQFWACKDHLSLCMVFGQSSPLEHNTGPYRTESLLKGQTHREELVQLTMAQRNIYLDVFFTDKRASKQKASLALKL